VPHVELSLIDNRQRPQPRPPDHRKPTTAGTLQRWAAAVTGAVEPSLVLDAGSVIVAASPAGAELLKCGDPVSVCGRPLREAVVHLVDFTDPPDKLDSAEADKIPPLLAISSGRMARGLIRVAGPGPQRACILDAIATPLWEGNTVVGSLTFFSRV
jgi:hypothetical protein